MCTVSGMKQFVLVLFALIAVSVPALGAPPPASEPERPSIVVPNDLRELAAAAGERLAPPDTPHLDLPAITVPLVQDGRLAGYAFLNTRLHLSDTAEVGVIRERLHFLMHELNAIAHASPFHLVSRDAFEGDDVYVQWENALNARLGSGTVTRVEPLAYGLRLQRRYR